MLADTALFLNRMIDNSDAPFIYEKIGAEINHVMIDEFQDTSRIQWKNFRSLLSNIIANNSFSMIVGDVKQSIYRWRNGDWSILNGIESELSVTSKTLDFNFRSEKTVIDFNNRLFTQAAALINDKFIEVFDKETPSPFPSAYCTQDVVQKTHKQQEEGYVSINFMPDRTEDGKYSDLVLEKLLAQIQTLHQAGVRPEDICILTRTNRSIIGISTFLSAQKEQHPALSSEYYLNIVSDEAFRLSSSSAIRIIVEALRVLTEPDNAVHRAQLQFFIDKQVHQSSSNLPHILKGSLSVDVLLDNYEALTHMPLFELIGHLFRLFQLEKIDGQSNYMFAFYDAVSNYLKDYSADIPAFLKYWEDELSGKSVPSGTGIRGIRAMTIHKSKGLQFNTVLVPYCDWDLYPEKNPIIWCNPKAGLYDLELLPVKYTQKMYETIFLPEYRSETSQAWLDNLNLLYVAFTRAERNLLIIAKQKKKLASLEDMKNVSDVLRFSIPELAGDYDDEHLFFKKGTLNKGLGKEASQNDNVLKSAPRTLPIHFVSESFHPEKSIFKQSNKSREFIQNEEDEAATSRNEYIHKGNIMHALFSGIRTMNDIVSAVERLVFSGIIQQEQKDRYIQEAETAIRKAQVENWFSDQYTAYNECAIIIEDNGIITHKQPDRVLINEKETIIIDYKFGEPHSRHAKQVQQYVTLMREMGYNNIKGYLWYVQHETINKVSQA